MLHPARSSERAGLFSWGCRARAIPPWKEKTSRFGWPASKSSGARSSGGEGEI